jgi:hypothetical protein
MVGGAVASLAATREPRARALPSRGSSRYGSLSQTPCAVNDAVIVAVRVTRSLATTLGGG